MYAGEDGVVSIQPRSPARDPADLHVADEQLAEVEADRLGRQKPKSMSTKPS